MKAPLRILLLADSHLGFDMPVHTRVLRRRRGNDFFANYRLALQPALEREVDIVVHAGDVFDRPDISPTVAYQAYAPLVTVAQRGVPVFIVPGNHERSRLPHVRFATHPRIHIFDSPRTFVLDVCGTRVALSGFPYEPRGIRFRFSQVLEQTGWHEHGAAIRLLCMHHCAEGAQVGPHNFTFTTARDVVRLREIPSEFKATLSGHIHRQQVLTRDLSGCALAAPVIYPGSIERTALAEIGEQKSFTIVHVGERGVRCELRDLSARPMLIQRIHATGLNMQALDAALRRVILRVPTDAVMTIAIEGVVSEDARRVLSAAHVRSIAPLSMNVEIREPMARAARNESRAFAGTRMQTAQLELSDAPSATTHQE